MNISYSCPDCGAALDPSGSAGDATVICPKCALKVPLLDRQICPGTRIGGFEIKELIGKGAMGEVYLARQLSMDRDVALKILAAHYTRHDYAVQRFLKEVRMSAQMEHPNIVRAYEAGEDQGIYYLAMALVKGESLADRLKRGGPYTEADALILGRKMADALAQAWQDHRLLHRDIKPANILLSERGEPLLADLGLAKRHDEVDGMTQPGSVLGTPNYMSPEQIDGRQDVDARSDMYGLGTTLYHAVTGQAPFAGSTLVETLKRQATEPLTDPRTLNPSLSESFVQILVRMLAKDPDDRYPDWSSLVADLDRVRAGDSPRFPDLISGQSVILLGAETVPDPAAETVVVPRTPHSPIAQPPPSYPHRIAWVGAGLGLLALGTIGGILGYNAHQTRTHAPTIVPPPQAEGTPADGPDSARPAVMSLEEIGKILDQASDELLALDGPAVRIRLDKVKAQLPPDRPLPPQLEGMERLAILINEMQGNLRSPVTQNRLANSEFAEAGLILGILAYQDGRTQEALQRFHASPSSVGNTLARRVELQSPP